MADSVKDALGGYLYQFLGAAGLAACAQSLGESQDPNRRGVAVASRAGSVVHEEKDMDVVVRLTGNQSAAGVQFKYSRSAPPRPIEASELIDILDALYRSVKLSPTVEFTEFVLISNRHFAPRPTGSSRLATIRLRLPHCGQHRLAANVINLPGGRRRSTGKRRRPPRHGTRFSASCRRISLSAKRCGSTPLERMQADAESCPPSSIDPSPRCSAAYCNKRSRNPWN